MSGALGVRGIVEADDERPVPARDEDDELGHVAAATETLH
jgi:hypothetical protein